LFPGNAGPVASMDVRVDEIAGVRFVREFPLRHNEKAQDSERYTRQTLPSSVKKPIMRESLGLMLFISNPWTYGRIASAARTTAIAGA
jgi:hypothetical protein